MKVDKIRNLTDVELSHQERELADELFKLKFQMNMAASMPSLTRRARLTATPSPRPGKMSALLAWATWYWTPSESTGGNGLPVAISARPPVQAIRSAAWASECEVGLDSGMTIGRATWAAISVTIAWEKAPGLGRRSR